MSIHFELLKKAAKENKIAHFLLFYGSGTQERRKAVLELAIMLNCNGKDIPCGECSACKKIESGNHPDLHMIKPVKTSIGIEQIINLQEKVYRKRYEGKYRVCLIEDADKLTLQASNALLKMTEEPPEHTIIILSATNAEAVIPTLRSRSQRVYYALVPEKPSDQEISRLSGGDPDLARKIESYGVEVVRQWLIHYEEAVRNRDFLRIFPLFPLERDECLVLLDVLGIWLKEKILTGETSPLMSRELFKTVEAVRKQVNHRLALEVLVLNHIRLGGTQIG